MVGPCGQEDGTLGSAASRSHARLPGGGGGKDCQRIPCRRGSRLGVFPERGKEVSAEERGQRPHVPLMGLLKISRKCMSAKLLETFRTNDIRSCCHQHSHPSLGPFSLAIRLTPNLGLTFLLVLKQLLEDLAERKPQLASPPPPALVIETICDTERSQGRPLPSRSLSGGKKKHLHLTCQQRVCRRNTEQP